MDIIIIIINTRVARYATASRYNAAPRRAFSGTHTSGVTVWIHSGNASDDAPGIELQR